MKRQRNFLLLFSKKRRRSILDFCSTLHQGKVEEKFIKAKSKEDIPKLIISPEKRRQDNKNREDFQPADQHDPGKNPFGRTVQPRKGVNGSHLSDPRPYITDKIGRASCRERVAISEVG